MSTGKRLRQITTLAHALTVRHVGRSIRPFLCPVMGTYVSKREPEVHVVVVQSQENGKVDTQLVRSTYSSARNSQKRQGLL